MEEDVIRQINRIVMWHFAISLEIRKNGKCYFLRQNRIRQLLLKHNITNKEDKKGVSSVVTSNPQKKNKIPFTAITNISLCRFYSPLFKATNQNKIPNLKDQRSRLQGSALSITKCWKAELNKNLQPYQEALRCLW